MYNIYNDHTFATGSLCPTSRAPEDASSVSPVRLVFHILISPLKVPPAMIAGCSGWQLTHMPQLCGGQCFT